MLVMEIANNSAKHVFQRDLGSHFKVELLTLPGHRAMLKVSDVVMASSATTKSTRQNQVGCLWRCKGLGRKS
jgi:hypothetical protein